MAQNLIEQWNRQQLARRFAIPAWTCRTTACITAARASHSSTVTISLGGIPYLKNVAYAYTLMMPGNAIVYLNAKQFGNNRSFPSNGRDDALGGYYGDTITKLVDIRNTHGRGNFQERWLDDAFNPNGFSNIYVYERENSAIVGLNSRFDAGYDERMACKPVSRREPCSWN